MKITFEQAKKFLIKNYKYDRLYGRGEEYGDCVVNSLLKDLKELDDENKTLMIAKFEHVTGNYIEFDLDDVINEKLVTDIKK